MTTATKRTVGSGVWSVVVLVGLLVPAGALVTPHTAALGAGAGHPSASPSVTVTTATPSLVAAGPAAAGSTDPAGAAADRALAAATSHGVRPGLVFVPRASATRSELARAASSEQVMPLYGASPAPMGLAYYGLSAGAGNVPVATVLNTTRLMASVDTNATGIVPLDLLQSSPDSYGIQLNAVTTGVHLFGGGGFEFWTQNVVLYYPGAHEMILITNVWNFSSAAGQMSSNALLYNGIAGSFSDGPNGTNDYGALGFYYGEEIVPTPVSYPFNLTLYLNASVVDQRNAISFGIHLTGPGEHFGSSAWDYVVFNSIRSGGHAVAQPSNYTADGRNYNPLGLTNDYELIFGGPGGGSQATLFAADAQLGLAYYTGVAYASVPAAFSYGGETGETSTGAHLAWSSGLGGPVGYSHYGTMTTGPSFLAGLWNATAPVGADALTIAARPANAISVITQIGAPSTFIVYGAAVAPGAFTNTFYLVPGNYTVLTELADYTSVTHAVDLTGPRTIYANLTSNPAAGITTPLWAFSNAEIPAIAASGTGTPSSPYVVENGQTTPISRTFGLYNDFGFLVYPAVLLYGTSVPTEFRNPASFVTSTNTTGIGAQLPARNDPPLWFWNVTNVSIVNASNISGWYPASVYAPLGFNTFSVIFYEGGHNLIANDTFDSEAQGLLLYSGGTAFGPVNVGGGNNTVWGNTFNQVRPPASNSTLMGIATGLGLEVAEPHDLVFNNWFATPTTAWELPANLYTGNATTYSVAWNVSRQPATDVLHAAGFPFEALTGSIRGTSYMGGNYWWDYGTAHNPYNGANDAFGQLPYAESATTPIASILGPSYYSDSYLYPGGDYVPLTLAVLYPVNVSITPVTPTAEWGVVVASTQQPYDNLTTEGPSVMLYLPNGSYTFRGLGTHNFTYIGPRSTPLTIAGHGATITLRFAVPRGDRPIIVTEAGLPRSSNWTVSIGGTSPATDPYNATVTTNLTRLEFAVAPGNYTYSVRHIAGDTVNLPNGTVSVVLRGAVVHLRFRPYLSTVTFSETGLPHGTSWSVRVGSVSHGTMGTSVVFHLANGTYAYAVHPKPGYTATYSGNVSVAGLPVNISVTFSRVTYAVTFTETGLPGGTNWSVRVAATTETAVAPASIVFAEPNGSYAYAVTPPSGYAAAPASGTVHVLGGPVSISVTFSPAPPSFAAPPVTSAPLMAAVAWVQRPAS